MLYKVKRFYLTISVDEGVYSNGAACSTEITSEVCYYCSLRTIILEWGMDLSRNNLLQNGHLYRDSDRNLEALSRSNI